MLFIILALVVLFALKPQLARKLSITGAEVAKTAAFGAAALAILGILIQICKYGAVTTPYGQ